MAVNRQCGKEECCDCTGCSLDESIPCSPDCENLTRGGLIRIKKCLEAGCEEVKNIFDMAGRTDEEVIAKYGEIATYPYDV